MELKFDNKISEKQVLSKANKNKSPFELNYNGSMLFMGDNFEVLSILLNNFRGKINLIYIDPPFNTDQEFFVSENGRANSISHSKNDIVAYSDKMSTDEYLEFIRERLILLRELLSDNGSIYLHIDYKIGHYIKIIMDEVFGKENFKNDIARIKSNPKNFYRKAYGNEKDLILFYTKNYKNNIWNDIKVPLDENEIAERFSKIDENGRRYTTIPLHAPGETKNGPTSKPWRNIPVPKGRHWRTNPEEFEKMDKQGLIEWSSTGNPRIKKYADQHTGKKIQDIWRFKDPQNPKYPTEKNSTMLEQIILQSSNENDYVLDCFAGSGSTLKAAFKNNRKWIGVDNSEVAINVIKSNKIGNYIFYNLNENNFKLINNPTNKQISLNFDNKKDD
ncbi:MAG TPA: site-specific DNA-methyltransferase [Clostridiaceae bacterium]|nr:site-specific DNA-methyltransferase [Clostridiaceae bacterium]